MLANAATPGWQGAIKDFIRVLGGELLTPGQRSNSQVKPACRHAAQAPASS